MNTHVKTLYERGDARGLIELALRAGDSNGAGDEAFLALRLLARLGDSAANAFCRSVAQAQGSRADAA